MADALVRIPGARPIRRKLPKEHGWNDRFWVEEIPRYDPKHDVHCAGYIDTIARKKKIVLAPGRIRRAKSPQGSPQKVQRNSSRQALGQQQNYVSTQILKKLTDDYAETCATNHVPEFVQAHFLKCLEHLKPQQKANGLARETENIRSQRSPIFQIVENVNEREQLVTEIRSMSKEADIDRNQARNLLSRLRETTLAVVEQITHWQEQMTRVSTRLPHVWLVDNRNYLVKLRNDTAFLSNSRLAEIFEFQRKPDPLLVHPASVHVRNPHLFRHKENLQIPVQLLPRIKAAKEIIELEYKHYLRRNKRSYKSRAKSTSEDIIVSEERPLSASAEHEVANRQEANPRPKVSVSDRQYAKESEPVIQEEPDEPLTFAPFSCSREEGMAAVASYLKEVHPDIKRSMSGLDEMKSIGAAAMWYWITTGDGERVGLAIFFIDTASIILRRISIAHISCLKFDAFETVLQQLVDYIFAQFPAQEIRISLVHVENEEKKLVVIPEVKSAAEKAGFKWKNLTNTADGRRILVMGVRNESEGDQSRLPYFDEVLRVKIGAVLQLSSTPVDVPEQEAQPMNISGIFNIANTIKSELAEGATFTSLNPDFQSFWEKLPADFRFPPTHMKKADSLTEASVEMAGEGLEVEPFVVTEDSDAYAIAFSSYGMKWPEFTHINHRGKRYIRIHTEIHLAKSGSHKIYLIPTDDGNFTSFVVTPPTEDHSVLNAMEIDCTLDHLALPATMFKTKKTTPQLINDPVGEHYIRAIDEYIHIEFRDLEPLEGALEQETKNFIYEDFAFGLIYAKMDEVPYLMASVVN